jgi:hypothetical protein
VRSRLAIADHEVGGAGEACDLASIVTELTKTVRPLLQAHGRATGAGRRDRRQLGPIEKQAITLPPSGYPTRPDPPANRLRMTMEHPRCISHADLLGVLPIRHARSLLQHQSVPLLFTYESARFSPTTLNHPQGSGREKDVERGVTDFGRGPEAG